MLKRKARPPLFGRQSSTSLGCGRALWSIAGMFFVVLLIVGNVLMYLSMVSITTPTTPKNQFPSSTSTATSTSSSSSTTTTKRTTTSWTNSDVLPWDFEAEDDRQLSTQELQHYAGFGLYSMSVHTGPISDIKHFLSTSPDGSRGFGLKVTDLNFHESHCKRVGDCAVDQGLKVFNDRDIYTLGACPGITKRRYFYEYREWIHQNVDAFLCTHPAGICEAYMAFNKSIIVIATTRFDLARADEAPCMDKFVQNLRRIAADPRHVIAANNLYDVHYIRYFTGIRNVELIPSYCGYVNAAYNPPASMSRILVGLSRGITFTPNLLEPLKQIWSSGKTMRTFTLTYLSSLGGYKYQDIASYTAVLVIPYQCSIMSVFEYYRMGIPMIVPSLDLLTRWHMDWRCVRERTWDGALRRLFLPESKYPRHPEAVDLDGMDPNNEMNETVVRFWLSFSDWYHWPHVIEFDSLEDLAAKLDTVDFNEISRGMMAYSDALRRRLENRWKRLMDRMWDDLPGPGGRTVERRYDVAMERLWGIPPPDDPCEECEFRPNLDNEQAGIRLVWEQERLALE